MKVEVDGVSYDTDEVSVRFDNGDFLIIDEEAITACQAGEEFSDARIWAIEEIIADLPEEE